MPRYPTIDRRGVVHPRQLGIGTADDSVYLRGDGTWATVSGSGTHNHFGVYASLSHVHVAADLPVLSDLTAPTGSVNFNDQQAVSFRVENRTSDPASPSVGQIWLRTDL